MSVHNLYIKSLLLLLNLAFVLTSYAQHEHHMTGECRFSELSVSYSHVLNEKTDLFVYLGYPGEPALGPVAFMHRPSAFYNPAAPISHHWIDATHITFGVATIGVRLGQFKLEGSSFTGRGN